MTGVRAPSEKGYKQNLSPPAGEQLVFPQPPDPYRGPTSPSERIPGASSLETVFHRPWSAMPRSNDSLGGHFGGHIMLVTTNKLPLL